MNNNTRSKLSSNKLLRNVVVNEGTHTHRRYASTPLTDELISPLQHHPKRTSFLSTSSPQTVPSVSCIPCASTLSTPSILCTSNPSSANILKYPNYIKFIVLSIHSAQVPKYKCLKYSSCPKRLTCSMCLHLYCLKYPKYQISSVTSISSTQYVPQLKGHK